LDRDAAIIKINSPDVSSYHTITQNYFGGSASGGSGNLMTIDYRSSFTGIFISGNAFITNNHFVRMKFSNTTNSTGVSNGSVIRLVYVDSVNAFSSTLPVISGNEFGSLNVADSLHFTQNFDESNVSVTGIFVRYSNLNGIFNNQFNHLRCYAATGGVELTAIYTLEGYTLINDNTIGNPAIINNIINCSNAPSIGISTVGSIVRIHNNTISSITNTTSCSAAAVRGIFVNSGYLDSIYNNTISHLTNSIGSSSDYAALSGIYVSAGSGGYGNLVAGNHIHNLQNKSEGNFTTIAGLVLRNYITAESNFIHTLTFANSVSTTIYGILVPGNESDLRNNMVNLGLDSNGNSITAANINFVGVSGGHVITHNSIYIGGNNVEDGFLGSIAYSFPGNALPTACVNNIF